MPSRAATWARRLRWVNPTTLVSRTDRAPARAMTRGSPKRNAPVRHPASPVGCATRAKAGLARTQPGPARSVSSRRRLAARARACSWSRWTRRRWQPRSPGGVADGLHPDRPAFFQVLLDAGVPVDHVDGDVHAAGDDPGREAAVGVGADAPVEDERDLVGPAGAEVVGHQRLEERPGAAGLVKDQGAGDLDLAHRQLPPVPSRPVRRL